MKAVSSASVKGSDSHLRDLRGLEAFKFLRQFLADTKLELETSEIDRPPGSLYIVPRDGKLSVTLKEASQGLRMVVEVENLAVLLTVVDAALASCVDSMWEPDPWARTPKKKKR